MFHKILGIFSNGKMFCYRQDELIDLSQNLEEMEKEFTNLPEDDVNKLAEALKTMCDNLKDQEINVNKLEEEIKLLPKDGDNVAMMNEIHKIKNRIIWLIKQVTLGEEQVKNAAEKFDLQKSTLSEYEERLNRFEECLKNARASISDQNTEKINPDDVDSVVQSKKIILDELKQISAELPNFESKVDQTDLGYSLRPRIVTLRQSFSELELYFQDYIASLQALAKNAEEMKKSGKENVSRLEREESESRGTPVHVRTTGESFSPSTTPSLVTNTASIKSKVLKNVDGSVKSFDSETSARASEASIKSKNESGQSHRSTTNLEKTDGHESFKDDTIDSSASPIHNEEVFELGSPNFEYYEEIKFKEPVDMRRMTDSPELIVKDHKMIEKQPKEVQTTDSLLEELPKRENARMKDAIANPETGKRVVAVGERIVQRKSPVEVCEVEGTAPEQFEGASSLHLIHVPSTGSQKLRTEPEGGSDPRVVRIVKRIIRKTIIVNGVKTETEEIVEEPQFGSKDDFNSVNIVLNKTPGKDGSKSVISSELERISTESPKNLKEGSIVELTPEKIAMREDKNTRKDEKSYSEKDARADESLTTRSTKSEIPDSYDSGSLAESTDIILSTDFSKSSDSTKPTNFQFPLDIVDTGKDDDENDVSVIVSERFVVQIPELKKAHPKFSDKKGINPKNEKETSVIGFAIDAVSEPKLKESATKVLPLISDDFEYKKIKDQKKRKKKRKDERDTPERGTPERDASEGERPGRDVDVSETPKNEKKILNSEKSLESKVQLTQPEFISQPVREEKLEEKTEKSEKDVQGLKHPGLPMRTTIEENIEEMPGESKKSYNLPKIIQDNNEKTTESETTTNYNKSKKPESKLKIPKGPKSPPEEINKSERSEKQMSPKETESIKSKHATSLVVSKDNTQKPVPEMQEKDDSYSVETVKSTLIKNNETPKNIEFSAPVVSGQVENNGAVKKGNTVIKVVEVMGEPKDLEDVNRPVEKVDLDSFDTVAEQAKYNVDVEVEDQSSLSRKSPVINITIDQNKVPGDFLQQTAIMLPTSASPEMVDISMQTSTPRYLSSPDKSIGLQTEFKGIDSQIQTSDGEKDKSDHSFRHLSTQTSEETKSVHETADQSQQTSKPVSPIVPEQKAKPILEKVDESVQRSIETEEVAAQTDRTKKRGSKENEKVETTTSESDFEKEVKHPKKDIKEPIEVHVKAKVTLPFSESVEDKPGKRDKKERKRKWKEEEPSGSDTSEISDHIKGVDKQRVQIEPTVPTTTLKIRPERPASSVKVTVVPQEAEVKISVSQTTEKAEAKKEAETSGAEKAVPFTERLLRSIGINVPSPVSASPSFTVVVPEDFDPESCQNAPEFVLERIRNLRTVENMPNIMHHSLIEEEGFSQDKKVPNIDEYIEALREALKKNDSLQLQYIIFYIIENIYEWFEYEILLRRQSGLSMEGPGKENVRSFELLLIELKRIKDKLKGLAKIGKEAKSMLPKEEAGQIEKYVHALETGIKEMQDLTEAERDTLMNTVNRREEFLNQVNIFMQLVEDSRQELERAVDSDSSPRKRLEELEKIEANNRNRMEEASKLLKTAKSLIVDFPNREIPPELFTTYEQTKVIESNLNMERDKLLQLLSLEEEYEQTLKEFAQIIDIAEHLVDSPINITDLQHLQEEMQKDRKFFVNLSHCRGILESLEGNLDKETRSIHSDLHGKLHERATVILDKAAFRAQQMAMAASRWTVLEQGVREEQQWLQVAQQRVPDLQQVMSSDYDQYISLYQSLASDIAIHHSKIVQLMDVANKLQDIITCVALENFYDAYLNVVLRLQNEVGANLEKLLAFQANWIIYELMRDKLDAWMKSAEQELVKAKDLTSHGNMRHFWELKAQFEVYNRLRIEEGNNFENAIVVLPVADEMTQKQIYAQMGDRWKNLEKKINEIQEAATATVSAKDIPVNDKLKLLEDELNELNKTVNEQGGIIKNDEELNLYIERLQVLNGRLETIQEELGRLGLLPAAESEKVGNLLNQARRLEQQLLEELGESNLLREKLAYLQKGLRRIRRSQASMATALDRCESAEGMGSDVVERAVENCQTVSDDLVEQWQELMNMRQVLHNLPMRLRLTVSPIKIEKEISQLLESHAALEKRCVNLIFLLKNRFCLWKTFEKQLELVQQNVQETDYLVELLTLQGTIDYDRLRKATDRLEDLHDSVGRREDLILELKKAAEPLCTSCDPEVSERIQLVVDDAVSSWNDTYQNLYTLRNKYKDAVKLWKQYREARDVVKNWLDQEMGSLQRAELHPQDAMHHVRVCEETLASHKARLDELRSLVAQIAADIGLEARGLLECEVDALGKRLEDVRETLTALTSAAEARTKEINTCKDELVKAKTFLGSVQKGLDEVDTKEDEDSMSLLRSYLLELGKTESQVQNVKGKSIEINDKPHEIRNETSVVEILELWQQVFRETFQQYHRLSAKLVRSQDGAAALRLWKEYLLQVQAFLDGPLPEDYDGLCEMQRVCGVYQNLLRSQHSVLLSKKENSSTQDFSRSLQEQFNSLANLHNETLARIMDRHGEISKRLNLWDTYRHDQSLLLSWLRDMTREQSRLQLRYINLRRVPKLLEQIDMILNKIPKGNIQINDLEKQQNEIVKFCDEALATSIKLESLAIVDRVNNLEASMKSWKDFLKRIQDLHKCYDSELGKIEQTCDDVTSELSLPPPVSFSVTQSRLDKCRDLSARISDLSKNMDEANCTFDKLKECLSHHDVKILSQKLWLMGQRRDDLQHQLMLQINLLEDRLECYQLFNIRHARFLSWANDLINKFEKTIDSEEHHKILDLESRVKRLESDILMEMNFKTREHNWLKVMGKSILEATSESVGKTKKSKSGSPAVVDYDVMKAEVSEKVKEVEEIWEKLQNLTSLRLEKKKKITTTMGDLRKRIDDIKTWLNSTEEKLDAPLTLEKSSKKFVDKLVKDHDSIQKNIDEQSGKVGEVLSQCETLLVDRGVDIAGVDTQELESAAQSLEKRWTALRMASFERKKRILDAWELLQQLAKICKENEGWLNEREKSVNKVAGKSEYPRLNDVQSLVNALEKEKVEADSKEPALKILEACYSKLVQESRLPPDNLKQIASPAKGIISKWRELVRKRMELQKYLLRIMKLREEFMKNHSSSVLVLTNISGKLAQLEVHPIAEERIKKLKELEMELDGESSCLRKADELGLELMTICTDGDDITATQTMIDEYQTLWKDLKQRFDDIRNQSQVESKEIQVSTLAFETDSQVQVNTLPHLERLTSRDAYGLELDSALMECKQNLNGLENLLSISEPDSGVPSPSHQAVTKLIATCTSSVELVQHLNETLVHHCGMSPNEARTPQVQEILLRFQTLVSLAREREKQLREASERGRLTCPICARRNWQQLDNDLWRLEQWIQYAEAIHRNRPGVPSGVEALEDVIQDHREFLIELDSHKSIVASLNIVGEHLADHADDVEKARTLRERLYALNHRWDAVCLHAAQWQEKLHHALTNNPGFHDTIDALVEWLETTELIIRGSEPVDLSQDEIIIRAQYKKFRDLCNELERREPRMQSLQEAAVQLFESGNASRERLNALRLRFMGLKRLVKVYLIRMGAVLGRSPNEASDKSLVSLSQEMLDGPESMNEVASSSTSHINGEDDTEGSNRGRFRFLGRVARASLPFQAAMLLILGAAVFLRENNYNCFWLNKPWFSSYSSGDPPV